MRIMVYPNELDIGGAALNAIDLATEMRHRGHDVLIVAPPGQLRPLVGARALDHVEVPRTVRLRSDVAARVRRITRSFRPDIVHTFEFGSYMNAFFGARVALGTPQLATVMSMNFPRWLPRTVPLTLGTKSLVEEAASIHRAPVWLLEPPVDLRADRAELTDAAGFAQQHGLEVGAHRIVIVSRLARAMKLEGIRDTMLAVAELDRLDRVQLVIAGSGQAEADVRSLADELNNRIGRRTVVPVGRMDDPRPAYAWADVVVGMGSSIIRGMAFGRPALVVGVDGFVMPVTPESFEHFDREGFWGVGGSPDRPARIVDILRPLLADVGLRSRLGVWGSELVRQRYGLDRAAARLEGLYERVIDQPATRTTALADGLVTGVKRLPPPVRWPYTVPRSVVRRVRTNARPVRI